ncbi:MAG: ThiF family adenylyltransferase, partial [Alphaproteobacteria bacterium]|nr:ThiF family adenylyltransferase [Alphaproteobacteria bacterium]
MDRLHRTRLLFGDTATDGLRAATVMVVGCGAVGSFAIEALARTGIGHIIVVDFDSVDESNINRQLFALDSTIGVAKVDVATARIHDINP